MNVLAISILMFTFFLIYKVIYEYILESKSKNKLIKDYECTIDKFINKYYKAILFIFVVIIFISRIYKFGEIPNEIGNDEAGSAYDAYCLANYGVDRYLNKYPVYLTNYGDGQSPLFSYLIMLFIKLIGFNIYAIRLPELILYIIEIIVSYLIASKFKDKRTALLFTFLIITCPWHIMASRVGLDCNLFSPLFMIDIWLLLNAKHDYNYIISGLFVGITLYTYAISWVIVPIFLLVFIIYMLMLKKINFKQIMLLGIPIILFAIPLIYMILLNKGVFNKTDFGMFSIPKLYLFRSSEINIKNIWKYGMENIQTIFLNNNRTIYYFETPFFIIGCIELIKETIVSIKEKEFDFNSLMFIVFVSMLITNFMIRIESINKGNVLYVLILYIVTIGMLTVCRKSLLLSITNILIILVLFFYFERFYYLEYINYTGRCQDNKIYEISRIIEEDVQNENSKKIFYTNNKVTPYIYTLIANKVSPYDFYNTMLTSEGLNVIGYENYRFINEDNMLAYDKIIENRQDEDYIFIIDKGYKEIISKLINAGYASWEYKSYVILRNY